MRKALGLKEDELKAFFIKASARQKQHGAGRLLRPRAGHRSKNVQPLPPRLAPPPALIRRWTQRWVVDTSTSLRVHLTAPHLTAASASCHLGPGEGPNPLAVTLRPFPALASQVKWAQGPPQLGQR